MLRVLLLVGVGLAVAAAALFAVGAREPVWQLARGNGPVWFVALRFEARGTELQQAISELYVMAAGPYGLAAPNDPEADGRNEPDVAADWQTLAQATYFNWRKQSIYGGSTEFQKIIMAKAFLGL